MAEDQAELVLEVRLSCPLGTDAERAAVRAAEERIEAALTADDLGWIDGDEFGGGACLIFCFGRDADAMYQAIAPILAEADLFRGGKATKFGSADAAPVDIGL